MTYDAMGKDVPPVLQSPGRRIATKQGEAPEDENTEDDDTSVPTRPFYLVNVSRDDLFLLAALGTDVSPLYVIEFLHRMLDIFTEYFGNLQESVIKDHFSTVYQLLEEMLDNGYPLTTEPNALKAMISPPTTAGRIAAMVSGKSSVSDSLPDGTTSSLPWRKAGVKYTQNEIYFDIVEEIDAILDKNGQVVSFEVFGSIHVNCRLSGTPDLTLVFKDPSVMDACSFHPCVRYARYERDRVLSFIPPDGTFELMTYKVAALSHLVPPIYVQPRMTFNDPSLPPDTGHLEVIVGARPMPTLVTNVKGGIQVEDIIVDVPFSASSVRAVEVDTQSGTCLFNEPKKRVRWTIGKMGKKASNPQMTGKILLNPADPNPGVHPSLLLHFKVPMSTVSGLGVETLLITNEKYKPYKGVRTLTKSGNFHIRT